MRILDRYILNSMVRVFIGCMLVFMMLYVIIDAFSHLDEILKQSTSPELLFLYYLNFLPFIFVQVAPITCLLGCIYTLGVLNRDNEIVAMRSSGLSIFQIIKTLLIFASLISILVFLVNDKFVPRSEEIKEKLKRQMQQNAGTQHVKQETIKNLSIYGMNNSLFFINKFIIPDNIIEGITILEQDELTNVRKKIVATKGIYRDGRWLFYECITYFFDKDGRLKGERIYAPEQIMDIKESPQDFLKQRRKPEFMTVAQLNDYISKLSQTGAKKVINTLKVDLYERFFMPLTSLIILMLGVPFSLIMRRRATGLSSIGIAMLIGFLYYVVNAVLVAFGKAHILTPFLAASLSHIIFFSIGIYLINQFS